MKSGPYELLDGLRARLPSALKDALRPLVFCIRRWRARRAIRSRFISSSARRRYTATARQIVFISEVPRVREAKIAHGLRRKGWNVVLLHGRQPNYDIARRFDTVVLYRDADDAVRQALRFTPVAYHVFSPSGDLSAMQVVNARVGPTVFDSTDLLEISYLGSKRTTTRVGDAIELQLHSIQRADGFCARDLQYKFAERTLGYKRSGRIIFFPEYCWGIAGVPSLEKRDGLIRCVQAGNFGLEKQGESDWGYLAIAEILVRDGIALDLYPNWTHFSRSESEYRKVFSDYLALASRSPLFRLHRPVSADRVVDTLRGYDFGLVLIWGELAHGVPRSFNPSILPFVMAARVFDYLDAGLPVILNRSYRLIVAMLRRYGVAVLVDRAALDDIGTCLRALESGELRRRAADASRGLAVERHVHRLERFYARVAADVGITAG